MESADLIVCGDYILTMNEHMDVIRKGALAIRGKRIIDVDTEDSIRKKYSSGKIMEGQGRVVLPGLINTHTHAAMVYFRGLADDLPLQEWLQRHIWPAENKWLSPEFISNATQLACLEMLRAGITTYNDMYFFGEYSAMVTKEMGMRAVLGIGILDFPSVSAKTTEEYFINAERFIKDWREDELITPCIAPHAAYTCSPETFRRAKAVAEKFHVPVHTHLAETEWEVGEIMSRFKRRPVEHLEAIGVLDETVLAAHCVWVDDSEIEILASRGVGVAHCMESNLKLASGFAPVATMIAAGVKVSFGTDGAASNNDLNILSEMATTAKVHKAIANDPTVLDARKILTMGTRWGAEVLGLGDKVGSIESGKLADVIAMNLRAPHLTPLYDVYSHIVYSAMASDVETVIVDGKVVIDGKNHTTAEEDEILHKAIEWGEKIADYNSAIGRKKPTYNDMT
ncbi:MAG: amidohydrolase family protein [Dissulfurispiraceae bacterium]